MNVLSIKVSEATSKLRSVYLSRKRLKWQNLKLRASQIKKKCRDYDLKNNLCFFFSMLSSFVLKFRRNILPTFSGWHQIPPKRRCGGWVGEEINSTAKFKNIEDPYLNRIRREKLSIYIKFTRLEVLRGIFVKFFLRNVNIITVNALSSVNDHFYICKT